MKYVVHAEMVCVQMFSIEAASEEEAVKKVQAKQGSPQNEPEFHGWCGGTPGDWDVEEDV